MDDMSKALRFQDSSQPRPNILKSTAKILDAVMKSVYNFVKGLCQRLTVATTLYVSDGHRGHACTVNRRLITYISYRFLFLLLFDFSFAHDP
jgi:hypothetical protein